MCGVTVPLVVLVWIKENPFQRVLSLFRALQGPCWSLETLLKTTTGALEISFNLGTIFRSALLNLTF